MEIKPDFWRGSLLPLHSPFGYSLLQRYNAAQITGEQYAYDSWGKSAICD
jgi:hypothetical protein